VQFKSRKTMKPRYEYANWVIPGRVMCGPFPGLDGINTPTLDEAHENIKAILQDGVNTFVSLQTSCETLGHPYFPQYKHYKDIIPPTLTCGFLEYPMVDQSTPDKRAFLRHMHELCEAYQQGRVLYIHCAGGHGRTGLYVSCLLMALAFRRLIDLSTIIPAYHGTIDKRAASEVMYYVQRVHDTREKKDKRAYSGGRVSVRSPNSDAQIVFVYEFAAYLSFL
jgi:hypothetical protein